MPASRRFALVFAVALGFVPFLPLYIERTMTHVMFAHSGGGATEWGWKLCTLKAFWANYHYLRPEQSPGLWLTLNVALALIYALAITLLALILTRKQLRARQRASITPRADT